MTLEVTVDGAPGDVGVLEQALAPEHADGFPGAKVDLERTTDHTCRLVVKGEHVPNVRAAMNAHLSWIRTIDDVLSVAPDSAEDEVS